MRKIQAKVLQLAAEIEAVCQEFGFPYALYGRSCGQAFSEGRFAHNDCELHLMVYASDLPVLADALSRLGIDGRAVETPETNSKLSWNTVRYIDTGTTLLNRNDPTRYDHLGAAVVVHPVYRSRPSKATILATGMLYYANGGAEFKWRALSRPLRLALKASWRPSGLRACAKVAYGSLRRDRDDGSDSVYLIEGIQLVTMPATLIDGARPTPFEDREFPVPETEIAEKLMRCLYDKSWRGVISRPHLSSEALATICDPDMPYEDMIVYLAQHGVDLREVQATLYRNFCWRCENYNYWLFKKSQIFSYGLLARDRIDYYVKTEGKLDDMRAASAAGDIDRLAELLGRYNHFTDKYLRRNLGFFTTQEIFDMAVQVWTARGKSRAYIDRVSSLVPEQHRKKDLKAYIDQYR